MVFLLPLGIFWVIKNNPGVPNGGDTTGVTAGDLQAQLMTLRSALAATENIEPEEAAPLWDELFSQRGEDVSIALNRALNRILRVDSLAETATSPLASDEAKKAARAQFTPAADLAQAAVQDFESLSDDIVTSVWLKGRIELHKAELIPVMGKSIRRGVFDNMVNLLASDAGKDPKAVILGGPLTRVIEEMEDPINGLPAAMLPKAAGVVGELSDRHPDNLFLAIRAAQLKIASQDTDAKVYTQRTYDLAKAIEPALSVSTKAVGLTPLQLVETVLTSIDNKDFDTAGSKILQWFNVTNPTEIMKTDRRRVGPHPLDRLSFDTLRTLSADAVKLKPLDKGDSKLAFDSAKIDATETAAYQPVDFDLDLDNDLVTVSKSGLVQLWRSDAGAWTPAGELKIDGSPSGMLVADLFMVDSSNPQRIKTASKEKADGDDTKDDFSASNRHNTFPGLIVYDDSGMKLIGIDGRESTENGKRLSVVTQASGLESIAGITDVVTGDLEGDGDLDLAVATKENGLRIFVNRGNRTFFESNLHNGGFDLGDPIAKLAIADIDRDLDLDIVTVHPGSGTVGVLENLLHLQFRGRTLDEIPAIANANTVAVADVDGNVSWDLIIGGDQKTAVAFSQTADAGIWTLDRVEEQETPGSGFLMADLDNDSWNELLTKAGVVRIGPWGIEPPTKIDPLSIDTDSQLNVGDFNRDGLLDVTSLSGDLAVFTNTTQTDSHHMDVRFLGQADNNARSGRVNHFGIGSVLELRFGPHYRSQIVTRPATHFGLGGFDTASSVRVIMPNGLTQTIREPSVNSIVEEKQTLKGSCPYLYAWDGEKFVFQTDCLWAAPLGLQVARGVVAKDRPWEYLKIPGDQIKPRDGKYHFRITEELWEVAYFDKIALTAVDHPADVDVWTNEKVGPGNIAKQTVFAFGADDLRPLKHAADTSGRDVTKSLAVSDNDFVQGFDRRLRQGLCPPHWVDMEFGETEISDNDSVYLVMTGWILPTDTSLNIQIDQNPNLGPIEFPSVWVPNASDDASVDASADGWRKAIPFMGFPGGKTKTIVVDVTDVILKDDPRLRVRTSAQIYWDSAKLAVQSNVAETRSHDLQLLTAEVTYHGFSQRQKESDKHPEVYDYQNASTAPMWPPLRGGLTQFGDCIDLVGQWDDSMVVISSGDEIQLTFAVPDSPVPPGWKRDFVLHSAGWDKDADLNTLAGQTIGPLPFRAMASYPPTIAMTRKQIEVGKLNAPHLLRHQSFRAFWSRQEVEDAQPRFLQAAE